MNPSLGANLFSKGLISTKDVVGAEGFEPPTYSV